MTGDVSDTSISLSLYSNIRIYWNKAGFPRERRLWYKSQSAGSDKQVADCSTDAKTHGINPDGHVPITLGIIFPHLGFNKLPTPVITLGYSTLAFLQYGYLSDQTNMTI